MEPSVGAPFDDAIHSLEALVMDRPPGARLQAERDLAEQLGVSRLTVREALRHLAARGLVSLSQGRRAVVREPGREVISGYFAATVGREPRRLFELLEIRRSLEALSATSAARTVSSSGNALLDRALRDLHDTGAALDATRTTGGEVRPELDAFVKADVGFHSALAVVGGNSLLVTMLDGLADVLTDSFKESSRGHFTRGGSAVEVVDDHRAVVEAVRRGDAAAADAAMRRHLDEAGHDLRAAFPLTASPSPERADK